MHIYRILILLKIRNLRWVGHVVIMQEAGSSVWNFTGGDQLENAHLEDRESDGRITLSPRKVSCESRKRTDSSRSWTLGLAAMRRRLLMCTSILVCML